MYRQAKRLSPIESGIFDEMNRIMTEVEESGRSVINLGIGSPDQPPAAHVVERLKDELDVRENYGYATSQGLIELRSAISTWYSNRFGVVLDPKTEVLTLMGSHDGLGHIFLALLNPGDIALIPDPHYPVYKVGAQLAEADIHIMPLLAENGFLPDLDSIPDDIAMKAKIMVLNYPNNPVTAVADLDFFKRATDFCERHEILLCHDAAYSELSFGPARPPSVLQVPGSIDNAVEFHSVSKTYNIAGCRLGFLVGNKDVISIMARLKSNLDYGVFKAIQKAGIAALTGPQEIIEKNVEVYGRRASVFIEGVRALGWEIKPPPATMFLWANVPGDGKSKDFAIDLLRRAGVLVIPGNAFGVYGEGYVRVALVKPEDMLVESVSRIKSAGITF